MRVLLVEESPIFRMGLRRVLVDAPLLHAAGAHADMRIVGDCATAATARQLATSVTPDLLVTGVDLPDGSGLYLAREVRRALGAVGVLFFVPCARPELVEEVRALGAAACLLQSESPERLLTAVQAIGRGGESVTEALMAYAGSYPRPHNNRFAHPLQKLSHRERQVFDLIVWGRSNKEVASRMGISVKTVESHRSEINQKLRARTTCDLVRQAAQWGLLPPGSPIGPAPVAS